MNGCKCPWSTGMGEVVQPASVVFHAEPLCGEHLSVRLALCSAQPPSFSTQITPSQSHSCALKVSIHWFVRLGGHGGQYSRCIQHRLSLSTTSEEGRKERGCQRREDDERVAQRHPCRSVHLLRHPSEVTGLFPAGLGPCTPHSPGAE